MAELILWIKILITIGLAIYMYDRIKKHNAEQRRKWLGKKESPEDY